VFGLILPSLFLEELFDCRDALLQPRCPPFSFAMAKEIFLNRAEAPSRFRVTGIGPGGRGANLFTCVIEKTGHYQVLSG